MRTVLNYSPYVPYGIPSAAFRVARPVPVSGRPERTEYLLTLPPPVVLALCFRAPGRSDNRRAHRGFRSGRLQSACWNELKKALRICTEAALFQSSAGIEIKIA